MSSLRGDLPSGTTFAATIEPDVIALAVKGRICCAHPRWMTPEQARQVAAALLATADHLEAQRA